SAGPAPDPAAPDLAALDPAALGPAALDPALPGAAADRPGQAGTAAAAGGDGHGIHVMHPGSAPIPPAPAGSPAAPPRRVPELAGWLAGQGIEHLYLPGCGDSAFAGLAASLAFRRHSRLRVPPVHALDLARYRVRYLPPASAVLVISFSGKVGRTTEAAR